MIIAQFFYWFYAYTPAKILVVGRNLLQWDLHYFSIGYLALRLFSPWHKDISSYGRGFSFKRFFHSFGWNLISRFIGAAIRIIVIAGGIAGLAFIIISTAVIFIIWCLLPIAILFLLISGFFGGNL